MKKLLYWGGTGFVTSAILEPVYYSGIGSPVPWGRDAAMAVAGMVCLYLLVKFRRSL